GAHAFGDDEIADILEDNGFASVRVNTFGTFQWVRGKNG
ncbi:MAG TPA: SAM-dependent methyltransferase, partial [Mycobacterium sp.]|nr:SAM-dependent methyltransferase [Mycobacterium sp.]